MSLTSLELKPDNAGYYDTLAHVYAAKGDLKSAIKYETKAAELEPHTEAIRRQLEEFRKKLNENRVSPDTPEEAVGCVRDAPEEAAGCVRDAPNEGAYAGVLADASTAERGASRTHPTVVREKGMRPVTVGGCGAMV